VRLLVPYTLALLFLVGAGSPCVWAEQAAPLRRDNPWGSYQPGAWKLVRTVTETFETSEPMTSIAEAKTSLQEVSDQGVTLQVQVGIEVGGKRFNAPPEIVKQGFDHELAGSGATVRDLGTGQVTIQDQKIDCTIQQWERTDVTGKTVSKVFYSDTVEPYVLRRETVKTDPQGKNRSETLYEVIAVGVPYSVLGEILSTAHVKTVYKDAEGGTTTTFARISMDVPGGVICHSLKEVNKKGCLIRQASLELLDYSLTPERERGIFHHRRPSRFRKPHRDLLH